jgi:hypothetical protein
MSLLSHNIWPAPGWQKATPLTAPEIDAHPDAARIWATIMQMRLEYSTERDRDYPSQRAFGR